MDEDNSFAGVESKARKYILLIGILLLIGAGAIIHISNISAKREFISVAKDYPFRFAATDSMNYVSSDFRVITLYKDVAEHEYKTVWKSENDYIVIDKHGTAHVNAPDTPTQILLTETYKKFLGKYSRSFVLTVVPESAGITEETEIVTIEQIKTDETFKDLQVLENIDGTIDSIFGTLEGVHVYNVTDAESLLEMYRDDFNVPNGVEFKFDKVVNTNLTRAFVFKIVYNRCSVNGSSADIVVNIDTSEVTKVSINIDELPEKAVSDTANVNYEEIILDYVAENDTENIDYEHLLFYTGSNIVNGRYVECFQIVFESGYIYSVTVDKETKQVVEYFIEASSAKHMNVKCTAKDDHGKLLNFDATYKKGIFSESYVLYDGNRDISCLDDKGFWHLYKYHGKKLADKLSGEMSNLEYLWYLPQALVMLADEAISTRLAFQVESDTSNFEKGSYAAAYHNIQTAYDFFKRNLGLISYDGKGSPIILHVDSRAAEDNAHWDDGAKLFRVGVVDYFMYPLGNYAEVMAHEYTHAVFGSIGNITSDRGIEVAGLNEAYADVFGILIADKKDGTLAKTYDSKGKSICVRDLKHINTNITMSKYSETYKDENWEEEEHIISTVISHIGYEMIVSGLFTEKEIVDIWYNSLGYVYNDKSTFLTCRKFILKAAEQLGIDKKRCDFIAYHFDQAEIYDASYKITTEEYMAGEESGDIDTSRPNRKPSVTPTKVPSVENADAPSVAPTKVPSVEPTKSPSDNSNNEELIEAVGEWKDGYFMLGDVKLRFPLTFGELIAVTGFVPSKSFVVYEGYDGYELNAGETLEICYWSTENTITKFASGLRISIYNSTNSTLPINECEVFRIEADLLTPMLLPESHRLSINGVKLRDASDSVESKLGKESYNATVSRKWYISEEEKDIRYVEITDMEVLPVKYDRVLYLIIQWPKS